MSATMSADGGAPIRRAKGRRWTSFVLPGYTAVVILLLAVPVIAMIIFSFNNPPGRQNLKWYGFTTQYYTTLLDQKADIIPAIKLSLEVAFISTIASTAIGTLLGLALGRYRFRGSGGVNYLVFLAIASPEIVLGTSMLTMFANAYKFIPLGFVTIVIAHVMFSIAFVAVTVRARVMGLNPSLEEAAQDLGADPITTFFKVTLPLIMPAVISGALLAFALSIDDFVITYFVAGSRTTFPLLIFGASKQGLTPYFNAVGTLLFTFGLLIAVAGALSPKATARRDAKRLQEDRRGRTEAEFLSAGAGH